MTNDFENMINPAYIVGVHLDFTKPGLAAGQSFEDTLLAHIITGALRRHSLLLEPETQFAKSFFNASGRISVYWFDSQKLGLFPVTRPDAAIAVIIKELSAVELISHAHLAWANDTDEMGWHTAHPAPERCPFTKHLADLKEWIQTPREAHIQKLRELLLDLGAGYDVPNPPPI